MTTRRTKVRLLAMLMAVCAAEPVLGQAPPVDQSASSARVAVFERIWATVNEAFYAPDFNGVDWIAMRDRYRPLVAASTSDRAAAQIVQRMLSELDTSHLNLFQADSAHAMAAVQPAAPSVSWRQERPGIGVIRIDRFIHGQAERDRLDQAFAELDLSRGLILDLRGNPGGDLSLGMRLADHLYTTSRPISLFATKQGLLRAGVPSIDRLDRSTVTTFDGYEIDAFNDALRKHGAIMLVSGGRAPRAANRRVVVLIDKRSASASEGVAGSFKDAGATIVGERSAGAMLSSATFPMGGGWMLRLPVADHLTPGGKRLEGVGVTPDIEVPADQALDRALQLLASDTVRPVAR